ncbi:MAG: L-lactate dehydrogenase complex protein LldG [Verrucomicrobiales bacterium]|jgi:L-lactate dehydrogenase complex protein LldG
MSDRASIFERLSEALEGDGERAPYPEYDDAVAVAHPRLVDDGLWENFARNFRAVNGRPMTSIDEVTTFLKEEKVTVGYCDPALKESLGKACEAAGLEVRYTYDREHYDDYQFGITQATRAIAETGTVVLTDSETSDRLGALTPWIHVAVLPEAGMVRTIGDAIGTFGEERNVIWATGPSKTGDIEGILIEGVHGPGEQICLKLDL